MLARVLFFFLPFVPVCRADWYDADGDFDSADSYGRYNEEIKAPRKITTVMEALTRLKKWDMNDLRTLSQEEPNVDMKGILNNILQGNQPYALRGPRNPQQQADSYVYVENAVVDRANKYSPNWEWEFQQWMPTDEVSKSPSDEKQEKTMESSSEGVTEQHWSFNYPQEPTTYNPLEMEAEVKKLVQHWTPTTNANAFNSSDDFEAYPRKNIMRESENTTSSNETTSPSASSKPTSPSASSKPTSPSASSKPTRPSASSKPTSPSASSKPTSPSASYETTSASASYGTTSPSASTKPTSPSASSESTSPSASYETTSPSASNETTSPSTSYETTSPSTSYETTSPFDSYETTSPFDSYVTTSPSASYETFSPSTSYQIPSPSTSYETTSPSDSYETTSPSAFYETTSLSDSYEITSPLDSYKTTSRSDSNVTTSPLMHWLFRKRENFYETTSSSASMLRQRTTQPIDINKIIAIISNLTYDYEWNLTDTFKKALTKHGVPTCPRKGKENWPTTRFDKTPIIGKCFVCGLTDVEIPRDAYCSDAFARDLLPVMPVDVRSRGMIAGYRKACRYANVQNYMEYPNNTRAIYGRFTGGCAVRWTDLSGIYTQRTCRVKTKPLLGKHFASKRMAKLERALVNVKNGCMISPMATLLPLSRGISLFARFHVCVCTGDWCNRAILIKVSTNTVVAFVLYWFLHTCTS